MMEGKRMISSIWLLLLSCLVFVSADYKNHEYQFGEKVILWVNQVGPYRNPTETYLYNKLPWCGVKMTESDKPPREGLGEALLGYELRASNIEINFMEPKPRTTICKHTLDADDAKIFKHAILNQYYYQMYLDDLPIFGMVGEIRENAAGETRAFLYTHKHFTLLHNDGQVIQVNVTTNEAVVPVEAEATVELTYSVEWHETDIAFSDRFDVYLDDNFFEHQIHWFSIFNSFMMVVFLAGLVSMILMRTLKRDYAKFAMDADDDPEDKDGIDESGWKQVHGDVFRAPPKLLLFASLVGTGHQLALLVGCSIFLSMVGTYYRTRGSMVTAFIFLYALTAFVGGYSSGGYYARNGGRHWIQSMLVTGGLFPGFCITIALLLNFVAIGYGSLAAFPPGTVVAVLAIWLLLSYPTTFIGAVVGKNWNGVADNPCRINPVHRQIPEKKWYLQPLVTILLGGVLPFGSIFIEMYFVFTSFWHYKYYYVYGFLLLVYIILIIVTMCVTVVSTYFLLNAEDHRWQWTSFLSAASTAFYVFLYSIYYFIFKTKMSGFFQTCFYFGYMTMFCVALGILCGAIGYIGTSLFVRKIYQIKID
eukprot:TRINITY_DN2802_c0_g1_i1.p1 TRINITY_DN2802_c0_g1~~TRINITY_DN2802_c0_g1_i1.p1  ORF type:complete len:590 (-),score=132.49 TRINITY_DN2802_c0_g1_i1:57-1826(-)